MKLSHNITVSILMLSATPSVIAVDAADARDSVLNLKEVSVTAFKLGERLADKPVAATVVGRDEIQRLNIVTMKGVSEVSPNFYIPDYGSRMTSSIYVRGIGARIDQPAVGLNVDNVPFLNKDNYDFDLVDIERIEVLRGPQSVLFGRNTMGGQINIYTLSPLAFNGVRLTAEAASGDSYRASVSGYKSISGRIGMSLSAHYNYTGGFFTNRHNGAKADRERGASARWKTTWRPSSSLLVQNTASVSYNKQDGYPYAWEQTGEINYNDTCFYKRTGFADGLTLNWSTGDFTLQSVTSVQYIDDNMTLDQDFLSESYFNLTQARKEWAFTQDLVIKGQKGRYSWLAGVFGFYKRGRMSAPVTFKETGIRELIIAHRNDANPNYPIVWDHDTFVLDSDFINPVYGFAAYHQSGYRTGDWDFNTALRIDYEHTALKYRSRCNTAYTTYDITDSNAPSLFSKETIDLDEDGRLKKSFTKLLPRASVSYTIPSSSWHGVIYASFAVGYKSGGYNTQMFSDVLQQKLMETMGLTAQYDVNSIIGYKPEKSYNYEFGTHFAFSKLTGSLAVFYIDCRDQQLTMFPDGTTTGRIMTNAGKTRSRGFELSLSCPLTDRLSLKGAYGMTDARFVEFDNGKESFDGNRVPYAPANTMFLGASYGIPVRTGWLERVTLNADCRGVGNIYWDESNTTTQPFYVQAGASVTLSHRNYTVDIWGENLTGTHFNTFQYTSIGNRFFQQGKPRRGGITLRINFNS